MRSRLSSPKLVRRDFCALAMIALAAVTLPALAGNDSSSEDASSAEIRAAKPGAIIRLWPLLGAAPEGAKAYRVLYRSTGLNDEPIAVSGAIIFPDGPPPAQGRDIVAWAHPTTGVAERCAPTRLPDLSGNIAGLDEMLERGYVVVATDYPGLGSMGTHPYLIGVTEAHAVLDSVRAARVLPDAKARDRFVAWGHSQGGHAALFTGELASSYAPELKLLGVAAAAPATNLTDLFDADQASIVGKTLTAMALWSWSTTYNVPFDGIVASQARTDFEKVAHDCIQSVSDLLKIEQQEKALKKVFLTGNPSKVQPWKSLMEQNSPGRFPPGVPVFLAQGTSDSVVRLAITRRFGEELCKSGTRVRFFEIKGGGHSFAAFNSAHAAVTWIADRFAGIPAPSDCRN
jgi:acetyl esterase/lipase